MSYQELYRNVFTKLKQLEAELVSSSKDPTVISETINQQLHWPKPTISWSCKVHRQLLLLNSRTGS